MRRILLRAAVVVGVALTPVVSGGCGGAEGSAGLEIDDLRLTKLPGGARIISGSVHNRSGVHVSGVLVQISLFDDHNNLLTSMTIGVEGVKAGGDREFREAVDSDLDVTRARVKKIVTL
ncbi:MAG TPA: FxLYD domain-containing protein [Rhodothermia bacterium]